MVPSDGKLNIVFVHVVAAVVAVVVATVVIFVDAVVFCCCQLFSPVFNITQQLLILSEIN